MMIAAKETIYNGYRFRSRLEARWAVFFDTLGVKYQYEVEDHVLRDGTRYLPDFRLPRQDMWAEIKGTSPTDIEQQKAGLLAACVDRPVYLLAGDPWPGEFEVLWFYPNYPKPQYRWYIEQAIDRRDLWLIIEFMREHPEWYWNDVHAAIEKAWGPWPTTYPVNLPYTRAPFSNILGLCGCGHVLPAQVLHDTTPAPVYCHFCRQNVNPDDSRLPAAYTAARQARFEWGESGAPRRA